MGNFFGNLRYKLQQWSAGRYGSDELNRCLLAIAGIAVIISFFGGLCRPLTYFYILALAAVVYSIFRLSSKNHYARQKERDWYLRTKSKISGLFKLQKRKWNERNTHVFYACPRCKTTIRVPKGRGRIQITCPKCGEQFIKKT